MDPRPSRSRLRTVMLAAGAVVLIAASGTAIYEVLAGGNTQHAATGGPSAAGSAGAPGSTASPSCDRARNTPGGPDPWGGCWPGPGNTGPRAGIALRPYAGPLLSDGVCTITANTTIAGKVLTCQIVIDSGNLTLEDSKLTGEVYNNGTGSVLIKDTVINGGKAHTETVQGSNITIEDSSLYGNQHEIYCGSKCTIKDSWLHDNYNGESLGWHQNGFLSTGGDDYVLQHNSVYCVGGCTSDIAFIPDGNVTNAVVAKNLLIATRYAAYCLYPSSDSPGKPGVVTGMVVTDNVFQRGANRKCATYGPVYGWDATNRSPGTSGYRNVWSGNIWNDGKALQAP